MPVNTVEIRARRELLKLSQEAAGERAGLGVGVSARVRWNVIESGKKPDLRISTLEAIAAVLGCMVQDLLIPKTPRRAAQKRRRPSGAAGSKG